MSANETVGDDTGDVDEPAIPDDEDEEDKADGSGDFSLVVLVSKSLGGGLLTTCASGVENVVSFGGFVIIEFIDAAVDDLLRDEFPESDEEASILIC